MARALGCCEAVLKARSPSCGCGTIYDGTFSGRAIPGDGVTAALLKENGIRVLTEEDDLSALGLVARLEYALGRFEAELAGHRRDLEEAERRLPAYQARLGDAFEFQAELDAKLAEMQALEADLAQSGKEEAVAAAA